MLITPLKTYLTPINTLIASRLIENGDPDSWPRLGNPVGTVVRGVYPVFTPPLNTLWRRDLSKNIPDSIKICDRVKVCLGDFRGGDEIILQEKSGQGVKLKTGFQTFKLLRIFPIKGQIWLFF